MTYEELQKANESIKTTDIKGKEYAEVNQRIKVFRMLYPCGRIETELVSNENGVCIIKATATDNEGNILGTGHAYEKEGSTFINKTSYIENCETSAVGRALGMVGIGIDTSVASAEEVANAQVQQVASNTINTTKVLALQAVCKNKGLKKTQLDSILSYFNYNAIEEIKEKDYMEIYTRINEIKGE